MTDLVSSKIFFCSSHKFRISSTLRKSPYKILLVGQLWKRKIPSLFAVLKLLRSECQIIVITSIHLETKGEDWSNSKEIMTRNLTSDPSAINVTKPSRYETDADRLETTLRSTRVVGARLTEDEQNEMLNIWQQQDNESGNKTLSRKFVEKYLANVSQNLFWVIWWNVCNFFLLTPSLCFTEILVLASKGRSRCPFIVESMGILRAFHSSPPDRWWRWYRSSQEDGWTWRKQTRNRTLQSIWRSPSEIHGWVGSWFWSLLYLSLVFFDHYACMWFDQYL